MSGASKWAKEHKKELLATAAVLGTAGAAAPALGLLGGGAAAAGAATAGAAGLGGGAASLFGAAPGLSSALLAATPAVPTMATIAAEAPVGGGLLSGMSGAEPFLKLAHTGMQLYAPEQQPAPRPQIRQAQPLALSPQYSDPEMEKRKQYEAWLAQQQGGIYG